MKLKVYIREGKYKDVPFTGMEGFIKHQTFKFSEYFCK